MTAGNAAVSASAGRRRVEGTPVDIVIQALL